MPTYGPPPATRSARSSPTERTELMPEPHRRPPPLAVPPGSRVALAAEGLTSGPWTSTP